MLNTKISEATITQDVDDAYSDFTILEQADMVISFRQRITTQYNRDRTNPRKNIWVTKEICFNAAGDVVLIRNISTEITKPTWSPDYPEVVGNL